MLVFSFLLVLCVVCFTCSYKQFSVENYAFADHELKTLSRVSFKSCVKACETERVCISVNFGESLDGVGCCTLNDCGVEDETNKGKSLIFTPGCSYHQVRPTEAAISKGGKYGNYCLVKRRVAVGDQQNPGKSCYQILQARGTTTDGEYWIDPNGSGDPFKVYCDMTTAGGGWTLIKRTVLTSSTPIGESIIVDDYRMISEQVENRIFARDCLTKLREDMGFDQLRFYCRKKSVGRTFHIMTNNNTLGRPVVRSMLKSISPRAQACDSYTVMPDDTSILSQNCLKWGYKYRFNVNVWGSNNKKEMGQNRLFARSAFAKINKKNHFVSYLATEYYCDDFNSSVSAGDKFELYVR